MPKLAALIATAAAFAAPAAAAADCGIAPMLPEPAVSAAGAAQAGSAFTLRGTRWADGAGCGQVVLQARVDGRTVRLATATVEPDGSFSKRVLLPATAQPGKLVVSAAQRCDGPDSSASVVLQIARRG